jgi:hypothetical protein
MSDEKYHRRQARIWTFVACCFILQLILQFGNFMYTKGKADKVIEDSPPVDLSDVEVPPLEVLADKSEMGYRVVELVSGRQVLLEGHINTVTEEQAEDYVREHKAQIPDDKNIILHVRRGRIIKLELHSIDYVEEL